MIIKRTKLYRERLTLFEFPRKSVLLAFDPGTRELSYRRFYTDRQTPIVYNDLVRYRAL